MFVPSTTRRVVLATLAVSALAIPASFAQESAPSAPTPAPVAAPGTGAPVTDEIAFPVRANDTLRVVVSGAEDLSGEFRVDATDGTITIARLGAVPVVGLSQQAIIDRVTAKIREKKLLKRPNVAVYLTARKARQVTINGAVQTQGLRPVKDGTTLSEVLEGAIPLQAADLSRVVLTRGGKDTQIDYKKYQSGLERGDTVNPVLQDGDKLYVYSSVQSAGVVRIVGEVKDSTKVQSSITAGTTAYQLIQQLGGITDYADRDKVAIVRGNQRIPVPVNDIMKGTPGADVPLQDGDVLYIPRQERPRQFTIAGAVREPKTILLVPGDPLTMTDALARAGGPVDGARQDKVEITHRNDDGSLTKKTVDLRKGKDAVLPIADGDYVFVPFPSRKNNLDPFNAVGLLSGLSLIFQTFRR